MASKNPQQLAGGQAYESNTTKRVHIHFIMKRILQSIALISLILVPFRVHADSFQNIPDTHVGIGVLPTIGDGPTATEANANSGDTPYWDISPFVNASSSFNLAIVDGGSTTTTQTVSGPYLNIWFRIQDSSSPYCDAYVTDGSGTVYGTLKGYSLSGGAQNYAFYGKNLGGYNVYYSLCQYVMVSNTNTLVGGLHFTASSTGNGYFHLTAGGSYYGGGRISALYSTSSSTEHEASSLAGCTSFGFDDCTSIFEAFLAARNIENTNSTHIISFTPNDGDVLSASSSVNFTLRAYIHPDDCCSSAVGVRITLHNIDQNTLLSAISKDDIVLYDARATSSGYFSFATSTTLSVGNYRINAVLDRSLLFGIFRNPFSSINANLSHQFIVGASTFLGNISQNSFGSLQAIFGTYSSTSTQALSGSCNLISGFDAIQCLAFLFIPSSDQIQSTVSSFREEIGKKVPLGYLDRFVTILTDPSTAPLPSFTVHILTGTALATTATFNMGDTVAGGGALLETINGPATGKSPRDVFEPFVLLLIGIAVLFTIISDLSGSHKHEVPHN